MQSGVLCFVLHLGKFRTLFGFLEGCMFSACLIPFLYPGEYFGGKYHRAIGMQKCVLLSLFKKMIQHSIYRKGIFYLFWHVKFSIMLFLLEDFSSLLHFSSLRILFQFFIAFLYPCY